MLFPFGNQCITFGFVNQSVVGIGVVVERLESLEEIAAGGFVGGGDDEQAVLVFCL